MTPVQVIGIGLNGAAGLPETIRQIIDQATLLVGSDRHLSYFPNHAAERLVLNDFRQAIQTIRQHLTSPLLSSAPIPQIVILTSGDPLFFGLGRLLLAEFPADQLTFHPHLSSVQLAFSRAKLSWNDARMVSAHGRSLDELTSALQQGAEKIAVLTDQQNTPSAIARLLLSLDLPSHYQIWVCENLGGATEQVQRFTANELIDQSFEPLNVVILQRVTLAQQPLNLAQLPALGVPDSCFLSFSDRPSLMTKREIRVLAIAELGLQSGQTVWDIGAGTGSVSIEVARLFPQSQLYAIEQTAAGVTLIQQNQQRFQVNNLVAVHGKAPDVLAKLPDPERIFIGGSGGNLEPILENCRVRLAADGRIVVALATLEHLNTALAWVSQPDICRDWQHRLLQVQIARSVPVGKLTRFAPLNPVTLLAIARIQAG